MKGLAALRRPIGARLEVGHTLPRAIGDDGKEARKPHSARAGRHPARLALQRPCSRRCPIRIRARSISRASRSPEFTSLCPVTGQPDFAHLVIDYVPRAKLVESKSLKLYLNSFRNEAAFHEDCTVGIGKRLVKAAGAALAAHRRLLVPARRHADRRVLADERAAQGPVAARHGRRLLSRPGIMAKLPPRPKRPPKQASAAELRDAMPRQGAGARLRRRGLRASRASPGGAALADGAAVGVRRARLPGRHGLAGRSRRAAHRSLRPCGPRHARWCRSRSTTGRASDPRAVLEQRRARGLVSVYALGRDYLDIMKGKLKQLGNSSGTPSSQEAEGLHRHRAFDGKTRRAGGGPRLARQAHQPGIAPHRLLAFRRRSGRDDRTPTDAPGGDHAAASAAPVLDACPHRRLPRAVQARCAALRPPT